MRCLRSFILTGFIIIPVCTSSIYAKNGRIVNWSLSVGFDSYKLQLLSYFEVQDEICYIVAL